jgi:hypothetical protein
MTWRIAFLAILFSGASCIGTEKPKWLADSYPDPLPGGIEITQWSTVLRIFTKVINRTGTTLVYPGYSSKQPQWYSQRRENEKWSTPSTGWCFTGISYFEVKDGESIEFEVPLSALKSNRRLVLFSVKDSRAGDLITIAEDSSTKH